MKLIFARFGIFLCTYVPLYFSLVVLMATFWTFLACTSVPLYLGNNIASSRMKLALYLCTAVPGQKKMAIFLSWWQWYIYLHDSIWYPPQENHYWLRRPVSDTLRRTSNYPEKLSPLADFSNLFLILFNFLQKIRKFRRKTCTPESAHKKLQTFYEKSVNFYFFYNTRNIFFTVNETSDQRTKH